MKRRLFNFAAAVSLVLCVAAGAAWVWSYSQVDQVYWKAPAATPDGPSWDVFGVASVGGTLIVYRQVSRTPAVLLGAAQAAAQGFGQTTTGQAEEGVSGPYRFSYSYQHNPGTGTLPNRLGFRYESGGRGPQFERYWRVTVPHWLLVAAFAVLPTAAVAARIRRRRRRLAGRCLSCGYDLRATPDRCPECGEPASTGIAA